MQGNDDVQSQTYVKGVTCWDCHDVHGTEHEADLQAPGDAVCTGGAWPHVSPWRVAP